jgi:hypothetical protein
MHINPFFSIEILSIHSQMELHRTTGRLSATVAHLSVTNNNLVGTFYPFSLILKQISTSTWVFIWNADWLLTTLDLLPRNGRSKLCFPVRLRIGEHLWRVVEPILGKLYPMLQNYVLLLHVSVQTKTQLGSNKKRAR